MVPKASLFLIAVFFASIASLLPAQDNLYLEHPGRMKRIQIPPGEEIRISFEGDKFAYPATFRGARGEWLFFGQDSLKVTEIDALYRKPPPGVRYWIKMLQGSLALAAVIFPTMILLNRTAVTGYERRDLLQIGAILGGSLLGNILLTTLHWRKYKVKKGKWRLRVRTPVERL